jgi:hypothetical protein
MKKLIISISLVLIVISFQSCQWVLLAKEALGIAKDVKDLIVLGTEIVEIINDFSEQSNGFATNVNEIQSTVVSGFKDGKSTNDIAVFWEGEWKGIHSKYDELKESLNVIDSKTNIYFEELTKNNLSISDSTLRKSDATQNFELRAKYNAEKQKAIESLNKAQEMLKKGDDLKYVLRNQVLRNAVEQNIQAVNDIALQAKNLSVSIQSFSSNCKPLFQSN